LHLTQTEHHKNEKCKEFTNMNQEILNKLSAPFPFEDVAVKIQVTTKEKDKGMVVFYLDSRTIQKRLDEVLGHFNWKNQYLTWKDNAQLCGIAIYNQERNEWIPKFDGAECSDIEPIRGGLSDSFKRAACMWGIGRYMYEIEGVWVEVEQRGKGTYIKSNQQDKLKFAYDTAVKRIFGAVTTQQPNVPMQQPPAPTPPVQPNQSDTKPTPAPQNTNTKQQPNTPVPQPPPPSVKQTQSGIKPAPAPPVFDFKIQSMKSSGKSSQLLVLCDREGEIKSAYIKAGEKGIAVGAHLQNVKFEERTGAYGKYSLITGFKVVA